MAQTSYDYLFKVLLTGNSGVGKSSLLYRYARGTFHDEYVPTIGVDFMVKTFEIDGKTIKLQLWDTGGQEKFRTITNSYYRGSHAVVLIYDVTNQESFVNLADWLREVDCYAREDVLKVIVANKCEVTENKVVDTKTAKDFATQEGIELTEVSAKTGQNVENLFISLAKQLVGFLGQEGSTRRAQMALPPPRVRQSGCCSVI